ncbi:MAG TPA: trigger factor [Fimbriimonadaceae bacterium]|nr:trigger factor [Fimbriimonadaceae bacterium]
MQVTREDLNPCTVKLDIVCNEDQVRKAFDKAYKEAAKHMRIPGFRPGAAPKHLVKQSAAPQYIKDFAAESIVNTVIKSALDEQKLEAHGQSKVEIKTLEEEPAKCEFSAKVPLKPVVELGEYKGLQVAKPNTEVTDKDVDEYIKDLQDRMSKKEEVTGRGVGEGDVATINIKIEGDAGEGRNFMVVAGKTFKALDDAISGMVVEEMKSVDLKFPKSFEEKDWAGKEHHCKITVRSVSAVHAPALDDAFAKELNAKGVDDLKEKVKQFLTGSREAAASEFLNERLLDMIRAGGKVAVPDNMWESVAERKLYDVAQEAARSGIKFEDYAKSNGMTVEEFVKAQQEEARIYVERAVVVREIFAKEEMKLSNTELNAELFDMAREYQIAPQELLTILRKNNAVEDLHYRAIYRKVTKFLIDNAKLD